MFSFVDKHLGDAAEGPRKPPERCRGEPCLHSSKPRETGVDNAVSATTDSAHTSFTTSRHATFRGFRHSDASPLLPRQVAGRALTLRPASPEPTKPRPEPGRTQRRPDQATRCTAVLLDLVVTCRNTGRTGALDAAGWLLPRQRPDDAHRDAIRAAPPGAAPSTRPGSGQHAGTSVGTSCPSTHPEV